MQRRARHRTHELPNRHKNHGSLLVRIIEGHLIRLSILQDPCPYVLIFDHLSIGQLMETLVLHQCATVELPTINKLSMPSQLARPAQVYDQVNPPIQYKSLECLSKYSATLCEHIVRTISALPVWSAFRTLVELHSTAPMPINNKEYIHGCI